MEVGELRAQICRAFGIDPTYAKSFVLEMRYGPEPPKITVEYNVIEVPGETFEWSCNLVPIEETQ